MKGVKQKGDAKVCLKDERQRKAEDECEEDSCSDSDTELERNFALISERASCEDHNQEHELDHEDESSSEEEENHDEDDSHHLNQSENKSSDREAQMENVIKKELASMSFEEIMKLRNQVGTKVYNKVAYGTKSKREQQTKKRLNKNRPVEMSAKKRAPFLRNVVCVKKQMLRDPRFDDLSGEYNPEVFEKSYRFIHDLKRREREIVEKQLKKVKTPGQKDKLEGLLQRMVNQEKAQHRQQEQREKHQEFKRKQRELAKQGHKPYFLKKSDKRKLELAEKYNELKKSGKLENFLSKKRKRNAHKDRKKLPYQHKP